MGTQADRTVVCVTDAKTDKCCAIFKSNVIQYKETFRFLYTLIYKYIPNSVIVVENNIDTLVEYIKNSTMRHLLYYETSHDPTKETRKKGSPQKKTTSNIVYGITTTSQNTTKTNFSIRRIGGVTYVGGIVVVNKTYSLPADYNKSNSLQCKYI